MDCQNKTENEKSINFREIGSFKRRISGSERGKGALRWVPVLWLQCQCNIGEIVLY